MLDIQSAIDYLRETANLRIPHDITPGSFTGGGDHNFTQAEWESYGWNPNPNFPQNGLDPNASPKPTWAELIQADIDSFIVFFQKSMFDGPYTLSGTVEDLIAKAAYGARSTSHEEHIKSRLAGTDLLARMNYTRDHYRQRYHEIKHWLKAIPNTEAGKQSAKAWNSSMYIRGFLEPVTTQAFSDLFTGARWTIPGTTELYDSHHGIPEYVHHDPGQAPFEMELTLETPITNDDSRQVAALHIFGSAKADYNLTYPTSLSVHLDKDLTGSPITQLSSARPRAGVTTVWIARRAGASTERELAAEISVFASPYGELKGAKTTVTFPAVPVAPPGG